ncbi:16S rRNA (guanine(966)-N(2))-methyltransferase RsmD [Kineobactrum sediminis]|uniref:Ribosomal RNA small subunit methyltransferase D n=1 Tax=Kineobactrum sediminis TaxID=1905677 RepID=A0A2N5Y5U6_9GAMM|nr:16S rRNA (guanine(966)-N(2))-methyltransferase RsmD [Kineobactrum sediminis]
MGPGTLRIIGGRWRSRKLDFVATEGLRPTTDRVRETLFNWLAPVIRDARCLDLFSGSGALGLEALSRGAAYCDFVDSEQNNLAHIRRHLQTLGADQQAHCHHCTAADFLARAEHRYDIVFIDPPFGQDLVPPACAALHGNKLLNNKASVYIETAVSDLVQLPPEPWQLYREKTAGAVRYCLYHYHP